MKQVLAVGLDPPLIDVLVTFPSLDEFAGFARRYRGSLAKHVRHGYEVVADGRGDEVAIDGERKGAGELLRAAEKSGAKITRTLGGNGSQEAAELEALGAEAVFIGEFSPRQLGELPLNNRKFFEKADFSLARTSDRYRPISLILQARGTNRYILCEGEGRRIDQLRSYLSDLPTVFERISDRYGKLAMVNLVGWHALFGSGVSGRDSRLVKTVIEKIRERVDSPLFTDAGGLGAFDKREKNFLCQIYSLFDILSVNEDEVFQVSLSIGSKARDEFQAMDDILRSLGKPSTIWLHSLDYQASLSTSYGREILENAQSMAAVAGVFRVEHGGYPMLRELRARAEIKNYSRKGLKAIEKTTRVHGGTIDRAELVITPCLRARSFTSTVGAGDVAAAAYTYVIAGGQLTRSRNSKVF